MNDKAEKVYGEAFFSLCSEEDPNGLSDTLSELSELSKLFSANPEFIKLMGTPTVSVEEKLTLCGDIIKAGKVSKLCGNLMCLLVEKNRMSCFAGIEKTFRGLYNDKFKLAEITVTSSAPLSESIKDKIVKKMSDVIGKKVTLIEKVDEKLIGGVVIDYESRRYDGSVRSRLDALKGELSSVI
ncbi:MAG: ATP synthase F1 subunit delta [Oscillospiraceae bacterium]|nr:ATP synthase F1 subunit delta [Oscillospiraceae bacterium]